MPMYSYKCEYCLIERDIVRPMADSDKDLTDEEFGEHKMSCDSNLRKYSKVFNKAPQKAYAPGWGSDRKGRYGSDW